MILEVQWAQTPSSTTDPDPEKLVDPAPKSKTPPDGGRQAWLHVFLGHMVFFNTWGVTNSYGTFQQYYTETLGVGPSGVSWIGAVPMFLLFFVGVGAGRASDAGYFRHTFTAGVILEVAGVVAASFAKTYWQILLSQGVCLGLGGGLMFTSGLSVTSSYFQRKRNFAVGLAAAGAATGGMVYPATVSSLLGTSLGYPWTMRVVALIMLVTNIPGLLLYRQFNPKGSVGPLVDWTAFTQKPFVFFSLAFFLHSSGLWCAFFYLGLFARERLDLASTQNLVIVLNGVGVVGRTLPNLLGERVVGIMNMSIFLSIVCAACILAWPAISSVTGLYVWIVVYGIFAGGMQSVLPALATQQCDDPHKIGTWTGMVLTIASFGGLSGSPIQGLLIQTMDGSYLGAQMYAGAAVVAGCLCLIACRQAKVGWTTVWARI
ncbi:monocarboxylate transporter [Emericellopsis atlantica]|uniref:Monocarboxylate transporter n=1 Tax=Emericellopsis atlantica TaxID=2614577 RepID=A0A9P7ZRC0_9HYPO|nr:monocarboxylate transporter [Emericellopsis atlantica]KAG9256233.1 monocarboxylate transporter [Emericellopsis atlantica]